MRPANIVTSVADVLAGIAISGIFLQESLTSATIGNIVLLCLATIGLYGGGIVFNDVFDYELDRVERPERVIPSGQLSLKGASTLGSSLLAFGIIMALLVNITAAWFAIFISISALVYNKWGKHHSLLGPPNMGLCRGLNLLLGVSILPAALNGIWYVAVVPILYISAITMISRGEVHGSSKKPLYGAVALYSLVILMILAFAWNRDMILFVIPFLVTFAFMIFKPLIKAIKTPTGPAIGRSVKAGVMALILMNSAWAASTGAWSLAILIVFLLPLSLWLSRRFAVT
ncbi:UbiA-like protein EboC [Albibacterium bauzanense]|nr:UbiA-like protein EboC [Albibacterium bauzanense]